MHTKLVIIFATGVLICSLTTAANADTIVSGVLAFNKGAAEFHAGDYTQALADFLAARRSGIHAPQLGYDLGVTFYHLGRYDEARREFVALTELPSVAALSHYNLGLIALQQHDQPRARREFQQAYTGTQRPEIRALATAALDSLGPEPAPIPRWTAFADAGIGYNSNVALTSESTTLTPAHQGSNVYSLLAGAIMQLSGDNVQGWQAVGTYYRVDYPSVSQFSQSYLHAGGQYHWSTGNWGNMLGLYAGDVTLGGTNFESLATISTDSRYAFASSNTLHVFYRYTRVQGSGDYDYLTGWHQSVGVEYTLQMEPADLTFGYTFDFNERNNYNTSTQFLSSSPTDNGLYAIFNWHLNDATTAFLKSDYQHSHYEGADTLSQGVTSTSIFREDNWWSSAFGVNHTFSPHWSLRLDCSFTDNRSNIPQYSYHSNQIMASLEYVTSH
ncbi:MAG: tetratricopeptide repeat protein [Gammaproteobacteria bacterium]